MKSEIQSILFSKKDFKKSDCKKELEKMKLVPLKPVHETAEKYRYRITDPKKYQSFRTKEISKGIEVIFGLY